MKSILAIFCTSFVRVNLFMVLPLYVLIGSFKAHQWAKWEEAPFLEMAHIWAMDSWPSAVACVIFTGVCVGLASVVSRDRGA